MAGLLIALFLLSGPPRRDTMRDLIKEAVANPSGADGGVDVAKLPFTSETIKMIVLSNQPKIQACYEEQLAMKKGAPQGTIKTRFTITPEGYVQGAKIAWVTGALNNPHLRDCVVAVLSAMEFPKPPRGKPQPIEFPFNLRVQH